MIRCPRCGVTYPNNTLFCGDCGQALTNDSTTGNLNIVAVAGDGPEAIMGSRQPSHRPAPETVSLLIGQSRRRVDLRLASGILLGRADQASGISPDLDLTPYGGLEMGVSRRHAQVVLSATEIVIEDLGSANGTFWNGQRLSPRQAQILRDGDEVRLGRLAIQVRLSAF